MDGISTGSPYDLATQGGALNNITELQSIPFRDPADFVVLLFALGSAAALAWRRRLVSFESALLVFAAVLSFRSQRDVWVTATVGAAILASAITHGRKPGNTVPAPFASLAAIAAALLVFAGFSILHVNNSQLQMQLDAAFPVRAVETVQQNQYPGPLYNDFNWGGYLTWFLRMPVSVDGRQNLYGDQRLDRSAATWNADPDWASDHSTYFGGRGHRPRPGATDTDAARRSALPAGVPGQSRRCLCARHGSAVDPPAKPIQTARPPCAIPICGIGFALVSR